MRELSPLDLMKILLLSLMLLGFISVVADLFSPSPKHLIIVTPYGILMVFVGFCVIQLIQYFTRESNRILNGVGEGVSFTLAFLSFMFFLLPSFLTVFGIIEHDAAWFIGIIIMCFAVGLALRTKKEGENWVE